MSALHSEFVSESAVCRLVQVLVSLHRWHGSYASSSFCCRFKASVSMRLYNICSELILYVRQKLPGQHMYTCHVLCIDENAYILFLHNRYNRLLHRFTWHFSIPRNHLACIRFCSISLNFYIGMSPNLSTTERLNCLNKKCR